MRLCVEKCVGDSSIIIFVISLVCNLMKKHPNTLKLIDSFEEKEKNRDEKREERQKKRELKALRKRKDRFSDAEADLRLERY
jgi:hypothetical protein